ncbi:MAG: GMC family oxidoreductase [Myxococcota bacterium]
MSGAQTVEDADVVVVGSGAGGGTLAWRLAKAGVKVVVLEKGPWYGVKDFAYHDELNIQKRNFFTPAVEDEPHLVRKGDEPEFKPSRDGWLANCVGGGTVHMSGFFLRLHPSDFEMKSKYGTPEGSLIEDWPFSYEEFAPWYDRIEYLLGVGGIAGQNPFDGPRRFPYPLPPIAEHPITAPFDKAAKKLGLHPYSTPRAILSRPYAGRAPCVHCGYCGNFGCEIGAKSSVLAAFIPDAVATKNCTILPKSMVTEVVVGKDGRATGVRFLDEKGALHEQKARVVVVACTSIESTRLLLASKSAAFPNGAANSSGLVGKNLHFSAYSGVEADFYRDRGGRNMPGWDVRLPFLGRSLQDYYEPKNGPGPKGGTLRFDLYPKPPIFNATQVAVRRGGTLWGAPLKDALRKHFQETRSLDCETFSEFHPNAGSYVELDPEVKDKYGLPVARVSVKLLPTDVAMSRWLGERAVDVYKAMGADEIRFSQWGRSTFVLQHGTARMGKDPAKSVLAPDGHTHDIKNLYVVDASFMPSSGGVPTTLTVMANALRVATGLRDALARKDI